MKLFPVYCLALFFVGFTACKSDPALYLDPGQPVDKRVDHLLRQMTLEEKVAQMCQYVGIKHIKSSEKQMSIEEMKKSHAKGFYPELHSSEVEKMIEEGKIGSFLHVTDPEEANYLQSLAMKSRLKIPLLIGIDAIHGNGLCKRVTIYPTPIGQAATFAPDLIEKASRETALEIRATGAHWAFTPNVDIARDPRWGRVGETFGEDPYLVSRFGVATVNGLQGGFLHKERNVLSCVKHLVGGGQSVNGLNVAPFDVSERTMREIFFPPFQACVEAGAYTLMMAHNEINGIPAHSNKWLMEEVARNEWNFNGFIVSDWMDIERLHNTHKVAESLDDAFLMSVDAGIDMHMHGPGFFESIVDGVRKGIIPESRIDRAVSKILKAKFQLGLFENHLVDTLQSKQVLFAKEHQQTALDIARRSVVLLENKGLLPIERGKYSKILITGPNADNNAILGDWAVSQPEGYVHTVLDGIRKIAPESDFTFVDCGWNIKKMSPGIIKEAARKAKESDLAIVVVGEYSMREHWGDKTCGENTDRSDIHLPGIQQELVEAIYHSGTPTVVILINGRPLGVEWISEHVPALIEAWEPGAMGGIAVAEILFGEINPSGKLPITIPRHVGQIQTTYNRKNAQTSFSYAFGKSSPLYEFGYGLSYTTFAYDNLRISAPKMRKTETLRVTVDVSNTGDREGEEVVQLYIQDEYSSVTRPVKELKGFERIRLLPGEKKTVSFDITPDQLSFYELNMNRVIENGAFKVMVGSSSKDNDLLVEGFEVVG